MTANPLPTIPVLTPPQMSAAQPLHNIWLSASAGSGKTQVLTARVIRLLLTDGVRPENLLCLTFTKAAAAEMSGRINKKLARWVQMDGPELASELMAIGADYGPEGKKRARRLFAQVLDAPGGGIQIVTIHAFCQSLLASFPEEAGLLPGFEPIEGRKQQELQQAALSELVQDADANGAHNIIENLQQLSLDMGEGGALSFLRRCASAAETLAQMPDDKGAMIFAQALTGIQYDGPLDAEIARRCDDAVIDTALLGQLATINREWGAARGKARAENIAAWLALSAEDRAAQFALIYRCFAKGDGEPMVASRGYTPPDPAYEALALDAYQWARDQMIFISLAHYAERFGQALKVGKAYAAHYVAAKRARGLVDFDDMIVRAKDLLHHSGMAEWVRYKLDRTIDHILIDEAQDTNEAQWRIVEALAADFYAGASAKGEAKARTIFSVGDHKQAIYGFQGTDPEKYREAKYRLVDKIRATGGELHDLTLSQSFRSTRPVLDFINAVIDHAGPENFGITEAIADHYSEKANSGSIELLRCVSAFDEDGESFSEEGEEDWLGEEKLILARQIAEKIKGLIDAAPMLASTGKPLVPGDVMILLRKRGDLARLLVARLHMLGVPVAGIDRLRIQEPLAVQDLLAVIRFTLQPLDDLSLACVLTSPIIGWDQDRLLLHGHRDKGISLWRHLRAQPAIAQDIAPLRTLLASADFITPYHFLEQLLSGPIEARRKLCARLGKEALVPIEELLNMALQYEQEGGYSLQGFVDWFERGGDEIKREGLAQSSDVRILTVHGAKGLEAPVVILADITADPMASGDRNQGIDMPLDGDARLPLLPIRKMERHGQLEQALESEQKRELAEHHRLLYVALSRAEEHLILAGALGSRAKGVAPEQSWFPLLENAMTAMGAAWQDDPIWGAAMRYRGDEAPLPKHLPAQENGSLSEAQALPAWLRTLPPQEERPPRPLTPSNIDDDNYGEAPVSPVMRHAAERGKLLHALFERYDGRSITVFEQEARLWLARQPAAAAFNPDHLIAPLLSVIRAPEWAALFSDQAKAEVPLAALVGETVISGRVDRLLITDDHVLIVDFKTGRSVPADAAALPVAQLRQMAHYVAAVETIFPNKEVKAALLFTHTPQMLPLPAEILRPYRPAL